MTLPADICRCLAHGCAKPDECARHVAIRMNGVPSDTSPVEVNLCSNTDNAYFISIKKEGN